jgi:hypothetical protein
MEHAEIKVLLVRPMPHTGDEGMLKWAVIGPPGEDVVDGRVVDGRLAMGVLRHRQALPLHPSLEDPENEVEGTMIAECASGSARGHREVRQDNLMKLGVRKLDGNGRGCGLFCQCGHGVMASLEDG